MWDHDRLAEEWGAHRAQALRTDHNESLAATIELSLSSPTFRKLGPNARDLLGVVSFFPQGVDEKNLEWFFPTISDGKNIFDKFCVLSLAHRSDGFVTMLAPIRDYLCPQDPKSSPLLCATKDCYFAWLSVHLTPNQPGFGETWWIVLEDVNIEHLLDVFTSIDAGAPDVWDACVSFMSHLYLYKPRQTVLRSKIETLPDRHPSKPGCLFELSRLFGSVGNYPEQKRLLTRTLALQRESGEDSRTAQTLRSLSHVNRMLGLYGEGIQQAEEALETYREFGDTMGQADCFHDLAWLLLHSGQVGAAEDAVLRTIGFLPEKGQDYLLRQSHHALGAIYRSKGEKEKAIHHFETAIGIATPFSWRGQLFRIHLCLALLFCYEGELDSANSHAERAKSYTVGNAYHLCQAMEMQAMIWYLQRRLGDAGFQALCVVEIYEKLGAAQDAGGCRELLRRIEQELESRSISSKSNSNAYGAPSIASTEIPQGGGIEGSGRISPP